LHTCIRIFRGILLISYSFLLFASHALHDRPKLVNVRRWKIFMVSPERRYYDAAYVNTIAGKRCKNERGRHEGEYPAGANEGWEILWRRLQPEELREEIDDPVDRGSVSRLYRSETTPAWEGRKRCKFSVELFSFFLDFKYRK